jgi:hypothetical protein
MGLGEKRNQCQDWCMAIGARTNGAHGEVEALGQHNGRHSSLSTLSAACWPWSRVNGAASGLHQPMIRPGWPSPKKDDSSGKFLGEHAQQRDRAARLACEGSPVGFPPAERPSLVRTAALVLTAGNVLPIA